jgi:hypothetical protein
MIRFASALPTTVSYNLLFFAGENIEEEEEGSKKKNCNK